MWGKLPDYWRVHRLFQPLSVWQATQSISWVSAKMIARLSAEQKAILNKRYSSLSLQPEKMKFIDRMVADSWQIALNHTAGLSLPQQMQMSLFAIFSLLDKEDRYKAKMQEIIHRRLHALWNNTGFTLVEDPLRAGYYSEIDMLVWARKFYGDDFVAYLSGKRDFTRAAERRWFRRPEMECPRIACQFE